MLPIAANFWESLGLGPIDGPKDVSAVCVAPAGAGFTKGIETFHRNMQDAYMSRQLGKYSPLAGEHAAAGWFQVDGLDSDSGFDDFVAAYSQACETLGG